MASQQVKSTFAPLPSWILGNRALTTLDWQVLGAIASIHKLGKHGRTVRASNATIAEIAGCETRSIPKSLSRLIELGVVRDLGGQPGKQRSRFRKLVVVYRDEHPYEVRSPAYMTEQNAAAASPKPKASAKPLLAREEKRTSAPTAPDFMFAGAATRLEATSLPASQEVKVASKQSKKKGKAKQPAYTPEQLAAGEAWYRAHEAARAAERDAWRKPTEAERAAIGYLCELYLPALRYVHLPGGPPPTRDERRELLRSEIGDVRFEALPDRVERAR